MMFFIPIESPERVTTIGILAANWFGWFGLGLDTFAPPNIFLPKNEHAASRRAQLETTGTPHAD